MGRACGTNGSNRSIDWVWVGIGEEKRLIGKLRRRMEDKMKMYFKFFLLRKQDVLFFKYLMKFKTAIHKTVQFIRDDGCSKCV
jgi:hypothetical protein